ncbi:MAG: hypothetical protein RLZZ522_987, partial [Verrucomicrobiota bacterium]
TWQPATGTTTWSRAVTLADGANLLEVRAADALGHLSAVSSVALTFGTPPAPPLPPGLQMVAGQPQLSFPTVVGKTYQLEWTETLDAPDSWVPLQAVPVPGTGASMTFADPHTPFGPRRFYRLVIR